MQMWYALCNPRDVEIERASKHFANMGRRIREILLEW
jgi:hypothetical protein